MSAIRFDNGCCSIALLKGCPLYVLIDCCLALIGRDFHHTPDIHSSPLQRMSRVSATFEQYFWRVCSPPRRKNLLFYFYAPGSLGDPNILNLRLKQNKEICPFHYGTFQD